MSTQRPEIIALIVRKIREINPPALAEGHVELSGETRLFGSKGIFDSIGLVSLIVEVEQGVAELTRAQVTLADERAMSQKHSPFRNVESLADYALMLVNENVAGRE
jgi:hypothetical protein